MKRKLSILLSLCLILTLCGCLAQTQANKEGCVEFFYPRQTASIAEHPSGGVLVGETRDVGEKQGDLEALLALYLRGPQSSPLRSPFPSGCHVESLNFEEGTLHVTLDESLAKLEGMDLTVACACLAKTCLALTDAEAVHIACDSSDSASSVNLTFRQDSLLLEEWAITAAETQPSEKQGGSA